MAVNLLCGGYHTDHVKYRLLFLIRPSWAREREGAYLCREEVYHVKQGADRSRSEPKGEAKSLSWLDFHGGKKYKYYNSMFEEW